MIPKALLFLIGPRGSGKTTVARLLAARLGWGWTDADTVLEARAGCSIAEVFARQGEPAFRNLEALVLAELCQWRDHVIATGGGVVLREENRALMRRHGAVVWLHASPEALWARLMADATTSQRRPDLAGGGLDEVRQVVAGREPLYRACADSKVETEGRAPEDIAEEIHQWRVDTSRER